MDGWMDENNRLFKFLSNDLRFTLQANIPTQFPNSISVSISWFSRFRFFAHFPGNSRFQFSLKQTLVIIYNMCKHFISMLHFAIPILSFDPDIHFKFLTAAKWLIQGLSIHPSLVTVALYQINLHFLHRGLSDDVIYR